MKLTSEYEHDIREQMKVRISTGRLRILLSQLHKWERRLTNTNENKEKITLILCLLNTVMCYRE